MSLVLSACLLKVNICVGDIKERLRERGIRIGLEGHHGVRHQALVKSGWGVNQPCTYSKGFVPLSAHKPWYRMTRRRKPYNTNPNTPVESTRVSTRVKPLT